MNIKLKLKNIEIKNIDAIIFDKDGTITNSNVYWSEIIFLRSTEIIKTFKLNKNYLSFICESMGLDLNKKKLLPNGPIALETRSKVIEILIKKIGFLDSRINKDNVGKIFTKVNDNFQKVSNNFIVGIDTACDFINQCHKYNIKLALITSDTNENAKKALKKLKLAEKFEIIIGGDSKYGDKTNGQSSIFTCEYLNSDPKNVICIGDTYSDYLMAKNAGLKGSILVSTGQVPLRSLSAYTNYAISSLNDISVYS